MNVEKRKIGKWKALVIHSDEGITVACYEGQGGPVVSASTVIDAENKFIEAMNLCESIMKLLSFCRTHAN